MKIRKLYFLIIIGVILVSGIRFSPTQAQERQVIPHFGVNFHKSGFEEPSLTLAAQANNYWVRFNGLLWSEVQLNENDLPAKYVWPVDLENDLINAENKGMEVILTVRSTPLWAQKWDDGNFCGPIDRNNFSNFAEFMYHVVDKYSDPPYNVKYYEIWNEPDMLRINSFGTIHMRYMVVGGILMIPTAILAAVIMGKCSKLFILRLKKPLRLHKLL